MEVLHKQYHNAQAKPFTQFFECWNCGKKWRIRKCGIEERETIKIAKQSLLHDFWSAETAVKKDINNQTKDQRREKLGYVHQKLLLKYLNLITVSKHRRTENNTKLIVNGKVCERKLGIHEAKVKLEQH